MIDLKPFRAWHPSFELIQRIAALPYDSVDQLPESELSVDQRYTFLQITRPELIDGFHSTDHLQDIYLKGAANLDTFFSEGLFRRDETPGYFIYQITGESHSQTGVFGCISVKDYEQGRIIPHEHIHPEKVEDRTRHILAQRAHAEPVIFAAPDHQTFQTIIPKHPEGPPFISYVDEYGVQHKIWRARDPQQIRMLMQQFDHIYIADGHHRTEAAARAARKLRNSGDQGEFEHFPAVIFPMNHLKLEAYHRVIIKSISDFDNFLTEHFESSPAPATPPQQRGYVTIYQKNSCSQIRLPATPYKDPTEQLDVSRLYRYLLGPAADISLGHSEPDVLFAGGKSSITRMMKMVDKGEAFAALFMHPPSISQWKAVADSGNIMPPKSTWFEPKLRSGLLVHTF